MGRRYYRIVSSRKGYCTGRAIDALSLNFSDISSSTTNDSEILLLNISAWKII